MELARVRYGTTHPEWVQNALWERSIREEWTAYGLRLHLGIDVDGRRAAFEHSAYRDESPGPYTGPFWSWQRFGRTSTVLPDGRVIHIAGEHEDGYDPDFCIYNDVVVEYAGGRREFYLYPKDVFPPTDFHSATLIGREIVLIGCLGYSDMRRIGATQVLKLDTRTLQVQQVATAGDLPGWICRHTAERLSETSILVVGGEVLTERGYVPNAGVFELDLTTMTWRRRGHGDTGLFPIAHEVYRANKAPRYGTSNPERSDNPFWLEMARRRWPARRARQHFGDVAPPKPEPIIPEIPGGTIVFPKLERTVEELVWTAVREDALDLTLADGRRLVIGGEVTDYEDDYADPWSYNDVVVTHPDGAVEILAYPLQVFPLLRWLEKDAVVAEGVFIFGHADRSGGLVVFRLDTSTYAIARVSAPEPPVAVRVFRGASVRDGSRVIFPVAREHKTDPQLSIAFDLAALTWSEPFPHVHPGED